MINFFIDKKNRDFIRLWLAQLISQFGDRLNQMALIKLVSERVSGSALDLAKVLAFTIIPVFIIGPIAGVFVDRWDRRRTLFICDLVRAALVLTIPFIFIYQESMIPIYIVVFLMFCFSRLYVPAKMSILPDIVPQENLLMANSLISTTGMIALVLGAGVGGYVVEIFGARIGFIGDAVTFLVAGSLIFSIKSDLKFRINGAKLVEVGKDIIEIEKSVLTEIKEGLVYLIHHKEIRIVINMMFVLLAAAGATYVVLIVFIQETFQTVVKDVGILAVSMGIGLFLGAIIYGKFGKKVSWYKTIFFCLIAGGCMIILFSTIVSSYPNILLAILLSFSLGWVIGPVFITSNMVVHLVSDEKMRGKVFSGLEMVIHFAFLLAMLTSAWLSERIETVWILVGVGGLCMVVGLWGLLKSKNIRDLAFEE